MKSLLIKAMLMSFCSGVMLIAVLAHVRDGASTSVIVFNSIFMIINALSSVSYYFEINEKLKKDETCSDQKT